VSTRRFLAPALLLACMGGCVSITDAVDVSPTTYHEPSDQVTLTPRSRSIDVAGVMSTPDPCFDIGSTLKRGDRTIQLTLTARRRGSDSCPAVIGFFAYNGQIEDLSPGRYTVIVSHVWEGTGWEEKRFERDVTVEP
jgi:hypothetical protein